MLDVELRCETSTVAISTSEPNHAVLSRGILILFSSSLTLKEDNKSTSNHMRTHLFAVVEKSEQCIFRYDVLVHEESIAARAFACNALPLLFRHVDCLLGRLFSYPMRTAMKPFSSPINEMVPFLTIGLPS